MAQLETVRGAAGGESSGQMLMHEHLFTLGAEVRQKYPDPWDEDHHPEEPMQFHFTPAPIFCAPEPMVELFVNDIRTGIAETGVKAGLLK